MDVKKSVLKKIKKYGFLAEPHIVMTESAAEKLVKEDGAPELERVYAKARGRHSLPDEAWEPVERLLAKKRKKANGLRVRIGGWSAAAACLLAAVIFFSATKTGRALAGEAVKKLEQAYEFVIPIILNRTPEPTESPVTETPIVTEEPAVTEEPTIEPSPTPKRTPAPTPAPTPVKTQV